MSRERQPSRPLGGDVESILRIAVSTPRQSKPRLIELAQPFAVVGRAHQADILLESSQVSFRHAYLQRFGGRVLCLDLWSKTGTFWGAERRSSDWLGPTQSVRVGPYSLQILENASAEADPAAEVANSSELETEGIDPFPRYVLEFFDDSVAEPVREIKNQVTLIGRSSHCHVPLDDESVSRVHCALVPTAEGLLVVDLLGKGGTRVDDKNLRSGFIEAGSVLQVGRFEMSVWRGDAASRHLEDATSDPNAETLKLARDPDPPPIRLASDETEPSDWLGTLFAIEKQGPTLAIVPTISGGMFRYSQLRIEANALRRKLADPEIRGLVIDLHALGYVGWEAISAIVALAREMDASGRRSVLCCPTAQAQKALTNMGLARIWPVYPTREAAVAAIGNPNSA